MLARFAVSVVLLSSLTFPVEILSAQEPPASSASSCLGVEHPDMKRLLGWTRFMVSHDGPAAARARVRYFEGKKMPPETVTPVLEEEICAEAVRILKADVAPSDSTAEAAAVVRVDGKYIAIFQYRAAQWPRMTRGQFYFDRRFTKVATRNML